MDLLHAGHDLMEEARRLAESPNPRPRDPPAGDSARESSRSSPSSGWEVQQSGENWGAVFFSGVTGMSSPNQRLINLVVVSIESATYGGCKRRKWLGQLDFC